MNGAFGDGIFDRKDRGQWLDIALHGAASFFEQISIRMREQDDGLFGMVDHFRTEARLIVLDQGDLVFSWNIGGGDGRKFIPSNAIAEPDTPDTSSRHVSAHGAPFEHIGE